MEQFFTLKYYANKGRGKSAAKQVFDYFPRKWRVLQIKNRHSKSYLNSWNAYFSVIHSLFLPFLSQHYFLLVLFVLNPKKDTNTRSIPDNISRRLLLSPVLGNVVAFSAEVIGFGVL